MVITAPPGFAEVLRGSDIGHYTASYDCGFVMDVAGTFSSPRSMARVGKHDEASAFFGHDNYEQVEVHTRRDTGDFIVLSLSGLLHDVQATRVSGSVFEFTRIDVGRFTVTDSEGAVIYQERGQIRKTVLFDTLGDDTTGGIPLAVLSEDLRGYFPDGGFDTCAALATS